MNEKRKFGLKQLYSLSFLFLAIILLNIWRVSEIWSIGYFIGFSAFSIMGWWWRK